MGFSGPASWWLELCDNPLMRFICLNSVALVCICKNGDNNNNNNSQQQQQQATVSITISFWKRELPLFTCDRTMTWWEFLQGFLVLCVWAAGGIVKNGNIFESWSWFGVQCWFVNLCHVLHITSIILWKSQLVAVPCLFFFQSLHCYPCGHQPLTQLLPALVVAIVSTYSYPSINLLYRSW